MMRLENDRIAKDRNCVSELATTLWSQHRRVNVQENSVPYRIPPTLAELEECRKDLLLAIEEIKKDFGQSSKELRLIEQGLKIVEDMIEEFCEADLEQSEQT